MPAILVVDDSPTVASTVEWVLRNNGYKVRVERDGLSTFHALRNFNPDLILLDVRLPHVDGIQICNVIRKMPKYLDLPIVMISGLSDQNSIERAMAAGANDYIVKPIEDSTLLEVIHHHLSRRDGANASDEGSSS